MLLGFVSLGLAQETGSWELNVCADPDNLPYSNRDEEGFENEIAAVLAEELGARLVYTWFPLPRREGAEELMLRMGACDMLLGVPDGQEPFTTTLAYYRSTAVFVTREDAPLSITSLDDPQLKELQIGVQRGSPEDFALARRNLIDNVNHFFLSDARSTILEKVADGTLDLGIVWGPIAGYYTAQMNLPLRLTPVVPEIDAPFLPMVQATSVAVRRTDDAFRDLLDRAIAVRWDEIQAVLQTYHLPLLPLPEPMLTLGAGSVEERLRLRLGVVVPSLTGTDPVFPLGDELIGEPARRGAILAGEALDGAAGWKLEVLVASAPSPEAARRAAERLIAAQDVSALIGGVGAGQAEVLATVAQERDLPFLNIGASDEPLRSPACYATTFNVEASENMYLSALALAIADAGNDRWFVVQSDTPEAERQYQYSHGLLAEQIPDGREVGRQIVPSDQPLFLDSFEAVGETGADAVVLLLDAGAQLVFLGQYETSGASAGVFGFPVASTQTRQYYAALKQDAPETGAGPRVALWDAALDGEGKDLNERFLARWGRPMDPSAWAAYAAVEILLTAASAEEAAEPQALSRYLEEPSSSFEIHKGVNGAFSADSHQLQQPLYLVELNPDATTLLDLTVSVEALTPDVVERADGGDFRGCNNPSE